MPTHAPGKKVVGLGLAVVDYLLLWQDASRPVAGNRITAFELQGGGMVGTALTTVARLGVAAEFWGAVGADWMGDRVVADLVAEGIDTSQVRRVEGAVGPLVVVCVDQPTGERHFLHFTGRLRPDGPLGDLSRLHDAGCLLIDATQPDSQLRAAAEAQRLGVPVVGDFGRAQGDVVKLLGHTDYAILSAACLADADGDPQRACRQIRELGPRCVVITLGDRGAVWQDGDDQGQTPAFAVDVVDTTGCGDVFHGAFCVGLVEGRTLADNLRFASAVAALKATRLGGRAGIPSRSQAADFLAGN